MEDNEIYRIPGSTYLKILLRNKATGTKAIAAVAIAAVVSIAAGFADIRYSLVGLMILLTVVPSVIAIVILSELLSPEAARGTIPHTVTIDEKNITIHYTGDANHSYKLPPDEIIPIDRIGSIKHYSRYIVLETEKEERRSIIIPKEKECKLPKELKERLSTFE